MKTLPYWFLLSGFCTMVSCHNAETVKTVTPAVSSKPTLQQPFRYHKFIEVAPGMDFDIFSWGHGPVQSGAYMILRSDSVGKKYTTTTGDVDGKIVDVFNTDLDTDGNPEIFIQLQTADSTGYDKVDAYEYSSENARKLDFPKLTTKQKKGYHGGDDFTVKEGKLIRSYIIFDSDNANAKATDQKRTLEYSYHGNSFSVKQISTDSTATQTPVTASKSTEAAKPAEPVEKETEHHESSHHSRRERHREQHHERRRESRHHEREQRHHSAARHHESEHRHHRHRR